MGGLAGWHGSLRLLDLQLASGIEEEAPHGPSVLTSFSKLQHLRLEYFRTTTKDIASLGELHALRTLIFWGNDSCYHEEKDRADVLDLSKCQRLKTVAFRSVTFRSVEERTLAGRMALRLP